DLLKRYAEPAVFIKGEIPEKWLEGLDAIAKDGGWILSTSQSLETLADLSKRCHDEGILPSQLALLKPSLEDVFFTLTGTALRDTAARSEEHTSELQSRFDLVCRLLLEKKNNIKFDRIMRLPKHQGYDMMKKALADDAIH